VFWQQVSNGILLGAVYALMSIGYSMVYGIMGMMNFAHGDVYMFGTYITFMLLATYKMNLFVAAGAGLLVGGFMAALVERFAYRPLRSAAQGRNVSMITALGAAYIIQNFSEIFWGVETQRFPSLVAGDTSQVFGLAISSTQIFTLLLSVLLLVVFHFFLKHTKIGKAIICLAQDIDATALMGIPINRTVSIVYVLGGVLGVAGSILYTSAYNVINTSMGFSGTFVAFTACVLGGISNLNGSLLGSLIVGLTQSLAGGYISTTFRDVITYSLLIVILLWRPEGILGKPQMQKV
jgi:branched-chain amino acid transport system permease protein